MKTINLLLVFLAVMLLAACDNSKLSEGRYDITMVGKCLPGIVIILSFSMKGFGPGI